MMPAAVAKLGVHSGLVLLASADCVVASQS